MKDQLEGKVSLKGTLYNKLYVFDFSLTSESTSTSKKSSTYSVFTTHTNKITESLSFWHQRLTHALLSIIKIVLAISTTHSHHTKMTNVLTRHLSISHFLHLRSNLNIFILPLSLNKDVIIA